MARNRRRSAAAAGLILGAALTGAGLDAYAASATGSASATVVGNVASLPVTIRFQAAPVEQLARGIRVQSTDNRSGQAAESAFGVTLVGLDDAGLATFSIAGATTSSYVVRTSPAQTSGSAESALPGSPGSSPNQAEAGLIYPAKVLTDSRGISIVVSHSDRSRRELTVMVNHN